MEVKEIKTIEDFNIFKDSKDNSIRIIKLGAEWCGPCRMLSNTLKSLDKNKTGELFIGEIDIENENTEQVVNSYAIRSIPVTLFFKDGNLIEKKVGLISANDIYNIIEQNK